MRDRDVRDALWLRLEEAHAGDGDTLMLDELSLCHGATRVDLAVINGEIQGYEVKSARDTLERLESQAAIYNATLDRVTIVCAENHLEKVTKAVPCWWGVASACQKEGSMQIEELRGARLNPNPDPLSIATLLWRDEALAHLEQRDAARGVRGKGREAVYERLVDILSLEELRPIVRRTLKDRCNWRADRRQIRCDG